MVVVLFVYGLRKRYFCSFAYEFEPSQKDSNHPRSDSSLFSLIFSLETTILEKREERKEKSEKNKKKRQLSCRKLSFLFGPPEGIRTPVLQNRNLLRYPTAPRADI